MAETIERARELLGFINANCERERWVNVGMALHDEFGEEGWALFDDWSAEADTYVPAQARAVWKSFKPGGGRTFATLVQYAKEDGGYDPKKAKHKKQQVSPEVAAVQQAKAAARRAQHDKEEAEEAADAALRAQKRWADAKPASPDHPYLKKKGVKPHGMRVGKWRKRVSKPGEKDDFITLENVLQIPMLDSKGAVHGLQGITATGDKLFMSGAAKKGKFFKIGAAPLMGGTGKPVVVLAEGFATGASIHEATGHLVFVAFDLGNMLEVARQVKAAKGDAATIILVCDNDTETKGNPGRTKATALALELGLLLAVPPPGDFNDLAQTEGGADAIVEAIEGATVPTAPFVAPAPAQAPAPAPAKQSPDGRRMADRVALNQSPSDMVGEHFEVLGFNGDDYFLYHRAKKQVLKRTARTLNKVGLFELAPREFWELNFTATHEGGGKFDEVVAQQHIYSLANGRGVYDPNNVRGRGLWIDQDRVTKRNRIVYNHGNMLTVDGEPMAIDAIRSRYVYPQAAPTQPFGEAMTNEEGLNLYNIAKMMRWVKPGSAALLAGWIFLAPICGALNWRPHVWLTGPAGSGKSYIQRHFITRLLAGITETYDGGTSTEAGIRQQLESDAMPVTIDEFEPNDEVSRSKLEAVLALVRQSSSESLAITVKGTAGGKGQTFHIRSMFMMASINSMLNKDSDSSRITQIALKPPAGTGDDDDQWPKLQDALHQLEKQSDLPSRLLSRGLLLAELIRETAPRFASAAAKKFGTQRHGDQFGALLCGAWFLAQDKAPSDAQIQKTLDAFDWQEHQEAGPSDWQATLNAIRTKQLRVDTPTGQSTASVFELITDAYKELTSKKHTPVFGKEVAASTLDRHGMRIMPREKNSTEYVLVFDPNHSGLLKFVEKLPSAANLRNTLKRIPNANTLDNRAVRFKTSGSSVKVVAVPMADLMPEEDDPI